MIDTDKYKGHSKGPWYWDGNLCNDEYSEKHGTEQWCVFDWEEQLLAKEEDMRLIADAPLILQALIDERAEVKRLNALIHRDFDWLKSNYPKVFDEMMMSKLYGDEQK
tara:strand:- start:163 stop:486 length:324 start_codon:yes stop_codon:yes gene_type:complete